MHAKLPGFTTQWCNSGANRLSRSDGPHLLEDEPLWKRGVGRKEATLSVGRSGNRIKTQKELHSVKQ